MWHRLYIGYVDFVIRWDTSIPISGTESLLFHELSW
jgi:hypothetical protein